MMGHCAFLDFFAAMPFSIYYAYAGLSVYALYRYFPSVFTTILDAATITTFIY